MMLNKYLVAGNLTRDIELRYVPSGEAVADIGLATNRKWKTETGEEKEEVTFLNCVAWGKQAEAAAKYLKKGSGVFIEGRLKLEQWEKNGEKRSALKVVVERLQFIGGKKEGGEGSQDHPGDTGAQQAPATGAQADATDYNSDIPF